MTDAVVIGGGPAGAAVAIRLARAGREVVVIERDAAAADKMCGEFLSREGSLYVTALGLDPRALGAVPIDAVRFCARAHTVDVPLPFPALSLSRRVLDEALLVRAASVGATVRRGVRARALVPARGGGFSARFDDGASITAKDAFLATGKHDLRGHQRPRGLQDDLVAFKMHLRLLPAHAAAIERHVELVLFEGGYAGLQPIEDGRANLCLVVRRGRLRALGQRWDSLLSAIRADSPHLDARMTGAQPCWARPLALSSMPSGHVCRRTDGPYRLGDQAAVIPSFSGDGMSIALHSAAVAAETYLRGGSAHEHQHRLARDVTAQVLLATALSHALVRRLGQAALGVAARAFPGLVTSLAARTRIPEHALGVAGMEAPA